MFRHLVRHSIQKNALRTAHWDDLAKAMYLVDGAGKSHGPNFEKEVPHRVVKSLQAKFNDMEKSGAVRVEMQADGTSTHVYEPWTQAWLLPEWDGSPANRAMEQCVKLLKAPDAHDANAAESDLIALAADDATISPPANGPRITPPQSHPHEQQNNARPPGEAIQELWDDLADGGDLLIELCCEILTLKRIAPLDDHPPAMDPTIKERMNEFHNLVMQLCEIEHRLEETYRSSATGPSTFKYPFKFLLWGYFANAVSSPATPLLWLQPESPAAA
ncbi:hypothetical protein K4K49_002998 [Colletotrichum sp. SAR 10_70]|nr:hypothetical protein K4K49_002998 [Colletotrichum sp. SAR 10_70]KAI8242983.1 hypothetical protein K4K53_003497 [Colletotrichum sp. SAR 10_77]